MQCDHVKYDINNTKFDLMKQSKFELFSYISETLSLISKFIDTISDFVIIIPFLYLVFGKVAAD